MTSSKTSLPGIGAASMAAVGCAMVVFALVAGGALTLWLLALGGLWLTLGLMHALATPLRD